MAASKTGGSRKTATKKAPKKASEKQAAPRQKKVMAWNTKEIREGGGSLVFISVDKGKTFKNIGKVQGTGFQGEKELASLLGVEPGEALVKKLGDAIVIENTVRYLYQSTGADRKAAQSE